MSADYRINEAIRDLALQQKRAFDQIQRTLDRIAAALEQIAGPQP